MVDAHAIRFAPNGRCSGGIMVLTAGSLTRTLRVDWLTGRVSVGDSQ
jgi:hypothetical protein